MLKHSLEIWITGYLNKISKSFISLYIGIKTIQKRILLEYFKFHHKTLWNCRKELNNCLRKRLETT